MTDWTHAEVPGDPTAVGTAPSGYLRAADPRDLLRRRAFALWGTGAFAGASVLLALTSLLVDGSATAFGIVVVYWSLLLLRVVALVVGWVLLARWMSGVRTAYVAAGLPAPAPWQVWVSWFIPIYGFWGPFAAMRALTSHLPAIESVRFRWWWGFVFSFVVAFQTSLNDSLAWVKAGVLISAGLLVVSFLMLRTLIDRTTESLVRA